MSIIRRSHKQVNYSYFSLRPATTPTILTDTNFLKTNLTLKPNYDSTPIRNNPFSKDHSSKHSTPLKGFGNVTPTLIKETRGTMERKIGGVLSPPRVLNNLEINGFLSQIKMNAEKVLVNKKAGTIIEARTNRRCSSLMKNHRREHKKDRKKFISNRVKENTLFRNALIKSLIPIRRRLKCLL